MPDGSNPFVSAVDELCGVTLEEGGCRAGPPADNSLLATATESLRAPLPAELQQLLAVTAEILGPDFEFRFEPLVRDDLDGSPLFQIFDYGNGDGWYLEPRGERCVSWWCGHDPYFLVRLDDSLQDWIRRVITHVRAWQTFEQAPAHEQLTEPRPLMDPRKEASPTTAGALHDATTDTPLREFLARLPSTTKVYDLRDTEGPVEVPTGPPWWRYDDVVAVGVSSPALRADRRPPTQRPVPTPAKRAPGETPPIPQTKNAILNRLLRQLWELGWNVEGPFQSEGRVKALAEQLGRSVPSELEDWMASAHTLGDPSSRLMIQPRQVTREGEHSVQMIALGGWPSKFEDLFYQPRDNTEGAVWLRRSQRLYPIDTSLTALLQRLLCWSAERVAFPPDNPPELLKPAPMDAVQIFSHPNAQGVVTGAYTTVAPDEPRSPSSRRPWWRFW